MFYIICDTKKKKEVLTSWIDKYNIIWSDGSTIKEYPIPEKARYIVFDLDLLDKTIIIRHGIHMSIIWPCPSYDIFDNTCIASWLSKYDALTEEKFVKIIEGLRNEES